MLLLQGLPPPPPPPPLCVQTELFVAVPVALIAGSWHTQPSGGCRRLAVSISGRYQHQPITAIKQPPPPPSPSLHSPPASLSVSAVAGTCNSSCAAPLPTHGEPFTQGADGGAQTVPVSSRAYPGVHCCRQVTAPPTPHRLFLPHRDTSPALPPTQGHVTGSSSHTGTRHRLFLPHRDTSPALPPTQGHVTGSSSHTGTRHRLFLPHRDTTPALPPTQGHVTGSSSHTGTRHRLFHTGTRHRLFHTGTRR